jgi:glycosyltransferase involved in cell wall biosynthesis
MSGISEPAVSVVLRTFDHAPFIAGAIESVLIQRAPFPFELVIGEDCSVDGTREIVRSYADRYPETIRAVLPEGNVGHGEILRRALEETRGDLVAYLDGDDYWTSPAKLLRQVEYLERNPECASCFHDVSLVYDVAGMPSGAVSPGFAEGGFGLADILIECFVPSPAMMFRREIAESLPAWVFESAWIDWLIHIRAAREGPLGYIPEPLAAYRAHDGGMFSALDRTSQIEEDLRFYERLLPEFPQQADLIERCMEYRHCQLAIERLGVPYDACVVLVDPRRELRPYFNGRHARNLPRRDGREVTELEAIRRMTKDLPLAVRDYGKPSKAAGRGGGCYVVAPAGTRPWLEDRPQFGAYLEAQGSVVRAEEWGAVYGLPPLGGEAGEGPRAARRVEVSLLSPLPDEIAGCHLEAPVPGASLPAHAISVSGWVLGRECQATAIELSRDGELLWRAPVHLERPDIVEAFPDLPVDGPGFRTTLNAQELPEGSRVEASAVLADGGKLPFAELRFIGVGEELAPR